MKYQRKKKKKKTRSGVSVVQLINDSGLAVEGSIERRQNQGRVPAGRKPGVQSVSAQQQIYKALSAKQMTPPLNVFVVRLFLSYQPKRRATADGPGQACLTK